MGRTECFRCAHMPACCSRNLPGCAALRAKRPVPPPCLLPTLVVFSHPPFLAFSSDVHVFDGRAYSKTNRLLFNVCFEFISTLFFYAIFATFQGIAGASKPSVSP